MLIYYNYYSYSNYNFKFISYSLYYKVNIYIYDTLLDNITRIIPTIYVFSGEKRKLNKLI